MIGLRDLIAAVKQELTFAAADARDAHSGRFLLHKCELEAAGTAEGDGKGEVSVKVLDFGGSLGGGRKRGEVNPVRVKFKPHARHAKLLYPVIEEGLQHAPAPPANVPAAFVQIRGACLAGGRSFRCCRLPVSAQSSGCRSGTQPPQPQPFVQRRLRRRSSTMGVGWKLGAHERRRR